MGWMLEKVGDWWMMGHCEEINVWERHNGDIVEEGKTWERGRRGEELELKRKLVLVENEEENNGAIGESGPNWKNVDDDCGLVVKGKEETEKKNIG